MATGRTFPACYAVIQKGTNMLYVILGLALVGLIGTLIYLRNKRDDDDD